MPGTTDTVKAILTPGEFVIRKEAVDMIGVPTLEKLNDMPEAGGHSEIDRLIAQATLKNMTGMYGGGMVNAKQYGHGGMVNKYEDGGQAMSNLKPVPDNNPGLAKLPEDVRNKMGYMQDGGSVDSIYNLNKLKKLMPMKASNLMGTFDEDQAKVVRKIISGLDISDEERSMLTPKMEKPMGLPTEIQSELLRKIISGDSLSTEEQQNFTPRMSPLGMQDGGSVLDMALRRAEPVDLLKKISQFEPPMAGKMYSQPKRNFFGELEEGQTYGKDILRPQEEKYLDHYESEHTKAKNNLIGFLPEDRELMFEFLNRSGVYDTPGEESVFKNNPNFKVPENEKRLARKLIRIEEKIDKRRDDLEKRIRVDSASKVPSQLDKYPRNLLSEEERKELFDVREKIQNSKSYQSMEDDQSRLYSNRQRRELQEEFGLEPKEEYKSLFGFDPNRDRRALGEDPREYEGEAPSMYDLPERYRKEFYSQYQKPKTGLLNLLGFMHGGKAKKKKKMYGYQNGGSVSDIVNNALESDDYSTIQSVLYDMQEAKGNKADELNYNLIKAIDPNSGNILYDYQSAKGVGLGSKGKEMQFSEIDGKLYQYPTTYSGGIAPSIRNLISKIRGVREISNLPEEIMGYQEGGAVQEDAMMQQYLQSLMAQQPQANPFVPFDQRPPSSGEVMSPIPSGMEQGDYYRSLRGELEMENEELVRDKAQNTLERIRLDSLLNQGAERIESLPDTSRFMPSSPFNLGIEI